MIEFTVPGHPVAWQRPRAFTRGRFVRWFEEKHVTTYREMVATCAAAAGVETLGPPVAVVVYSNFAMPTSEHRKTERARKPRRWHTKRPDADNLSKCILDALEGRAFVADSHVALLVCRKVIARQDEPAETHVCVAECPPLDRLPASPSGFLRFIVDGGRGMP